jgi:hypothetical protein
MTIKAHFDGKVFVPDEPVDLPKDQQVVVEVQPAPAEERKPITAGELANSEIVGMWADREDIGDSVEFVNNIRRRIERREL